MTTTLKTSRKALQTIFDDWYTDAPSVTGEFVKEIDYKARNDDKSDSKKWGEFQTLGTDFDGKKVIIKELPEMNGKELWEVGEYIKSKGWTPVGYEYVQYLSEHPEAQATKETWKWNLCFGSLFRNSDGDWRVPYVQWDGSGFGRGGDRLGDGWSDVCRVVLLETIDLEPESLKPLNFDPLILALENVITELKKLQ